MGIINKAPQTHVIRKKSRRHLLTMLFILFNVAVIAVTAYVDFFRDPSAVTTASFLGVNLWYLLGAAGCLAMVFLAESAKYMLMMKRLCNRACFRQSFQVAALGKYYDNITPLGAGGQPFQVYYLHKQGFSNGVAAAMPIAAFLTMQTAFVLIAIVVLCCGASVITIGAIRISSFIGLLFYAFLPLLIIAFALWPELASGVVKWGVHIGSRLHLVKDEVHTMESSLSTLNDYRDSIITIYQTRFLFFELFILALIYQFALCSLPFFVLRAFGGALDYWPVFAMCVFIYTAIAYVPTPGNAGVAEVSFYALFSTLTAGYLFWAMLVWRFFCYYAFIITGLGIYAVSALKKRKERSVDG